MKPRKPAVKDSLQKSTRLRRKPIKQIETATKAAAKAANKKVNAEDASAGLNLESSA